MYEAFYSLRFRPFGAEVGAGGCWFAPTIDQSVQRAVASLQNGTEAVLVSGPSGSGRSAVCRELARRLSDRLQPVLLAHCEFATPGDLWRAILFELGREFAASTEEELRMSVLREARALRPERNGLLVVADDADSLSVGLLDDLRRLTVQRHEGRPIVQLVLAGSLALEERLAIPELSNLSQRIGLHIALELLTREQSRQYVDHRVRAAGGQIGELFTADAVDAIVAASDGNFHCLNQLCDHSLLLGFAAEERPVSARTVFAALDDLKGLSLPWNVPADHSAGPSPSYDPSLGLDEEDAPVDWHGRTAVDIRDLPTVDSVSESRSWWDDAADSATIEVGAAELAEPSAMSPPEQNPMNRPERYAGLPATYTHERGAGISPPVETVVEDRYAELDRRAEARRGDAQGVPMPQRERSTPHFPRESDALPVDTESDHETGRMPTAKTGGVETKLLLDVTSLRNEILQSEAAAPSPAVNRRPACEMSPADPQWDIVQPEPDVRIVARQAVPAAVEPVDAAHARTEPMIDPATMKAESDAAARRRQEIPPERRYARLFTRLQQRRATTAAEATTWPLRLWR